MIFREKAELLSLYNALANTEYTNPDEIQVVTLENAIYMNMKNDLAFILDSQLHMYEHQSTFNSNMPLRNLFYVAKELEKMVDINRLYYHSQCKIPTPRFVVFYNGKKEADDCWQERLSDAFVNPTNAPELELVVTYYNINAGHNSELMQRCKALNDYSVFVDIVRNNSAEMPLNEAIEKAVEECLHRNVLSEFLDRNRKEAGQVILYEFDEESYKEFVYENGVKDGVQQGMQQGLQQGMQQGLQQGMQQGVQQGVQQERGAIISKLVRNMNYSVTQAMDFLEIPADERHAYMEMAEL